MKGTLTVDEDGRGEVVEVESKTGWKPAVEVSAASSIETPKQIKHFLIF